MSRTTKQAWLETRAPDHEEEATIPPAPFFRELCADARRLPIADASVDCIVTSPPYWRKRDYGVESQIGQEDTPHDYAATIMSCLAEWKRVLRPHGSVFLNVGDTYERQSLAGIPFLIEQRAAAAGWLVRNRIIWTKTGGIPEPSRRRLANRHEYVLHLTPSRRYYYDIFGYSEVFGNGSNPGDIWPMALERKLGAHLAPFPEELVHRALLLACPARVCPRCGEPSERIVERTFELNPARPQARRALELAERSNLTPAHFRAIQATGISDAGKALKIQTGTGRNSQQVRKLAAEAKQVLGGYFREFTFGKQKSCGWTVCTCRKGFVPGVVLDPFAGTGTTGRVASRLGRSMIACDIAHDHAASS